MPRNIHPQPFVIHPRDDLLRKYPDLRRASSALANLYAERQVVVTDEHLQAMGGALWRALDAQADFDAAHANAGAAILPIVIESMAADIQALPWETLHHPTLGFLGKNPAFTMTRRIATRGSQTKIEKGPLKVLLFTSMPDDVDAEKGRLNVEEEQAQVQEALAPWIAQGLVKLEMPDDGRFSTFTEMLKWNPHVVFLSGHGKFHHVPHTGEPPYGEFLFESETGNGESIREDEIASALVGTGAQAVIVSACESGKAASDALTNGLMQRISARGIPHVIGMRESVLDRAGIQFARALCDELAKQERIDFALQAARIAIQKPLQDSARRETGISAAAELSLGQWCLPMLVSANPETPLIDWDFPATPVHARNIVRALNNVSMPARFIGRRAEMRKYKKDLLEGKLRKLLITGPGGQGKTSLAGKLALDLQAQGFKIFAWSARPEQHWRDFEFKGMELELNQVNADKFDRFKGNRPSDLHRADFLIDLLIEQFEGRTLFVFDNLESIQDADTLQVKDQTVRAWLDCLQTKNDTRVIATSRWQLPRWQGESLPLAHARYGDFLQMAQERLPQSFLRTRERLRQVYDALGGNSRGLDFFAAALKTLRNADEANAFMETLARTKSDLQANMAIATIVEHLPDDAKKFLQRLPAYQEPVPMEGILKLGLDLLQPEALMERLLNVSLLEARYEAQWDVTEYQCAPLVTDWLASRGQGLVGNDPRWLNNAADFHLYLFANERRILTQAIAAHRALRRAGRDTEADRLTLDVIVGPLTRAGFYTTLLIEWLPKICNSEDMKTRAEALGQTGKLHIHLGNFKEGLPYLKQSLTIQQQIGDKAGEGTTLNNISQIYDAQGDYETALSYLKQSLTIQQQIGNKAGEGATLNNISQIYDAQGDYETALSYLKQSLTIWQQIGDKQGESVTLNNIANIYHAHGDYETALEYRKKGLAICQQIGDKAGEGATLNNIGSNFYAQKDYASALNYYKQSIAIRQQIGDKAGQCNSLYCMGLIHAQNNQIQEAGRAWVTAYVIAKQINEAQALQALSKLAPQLGMPEGLQGWEMLAQQVQSGAGESGKAPAP